MANCPQTAVCMNCCWNGWTNCKNLPTTDRPARRKTRRDSVLDDDVAGPFISPSTVATNFHAFEKNTILQSLIRAILYCANSPQSTLEHAAAQLVVGAQSSRRADAHLMLESRPRTDIRVLTLHKAD